MLMGNPFVGNVDKKLTKEELIQALRVDIAGELEAIVTYDAHAIAADDERVKTILYSIRDEERQHVGELIHLMEILDPQEAQLLSKGKQEVDQLLNQQGQQGVGSQGQQVQAAQMQYGQEGMQGTQTRGVPGQQHSIPYPPYPGNLGHRGPHNNWK